MNKTKDMIYCAIFVALIAVGAFIKVPIPYVPFTLQLFFTMMAGLMLGARKGAICVLVYILLGLVGFPVFASGGGLSYVFQPTFGYLIGFVVGTFATGYIAHLNANITTKRVLIANFVGLMIVYAFGIVYYWLIATYYIGSGIAVGTLILYCFILTVPGDIVLCILASLVYKRINKVLVLDNGR